MKHAARSVALTVAVVVTALAVVLATQVGSDPKAEQKKSRLLGKTAPAFSVRELDGSTVSGTGLAGRVVIVNFWNTWCIPCQEELPALKDFYARHAEDPDFVMVGIVRDDTTRAVRAYVKSEMLGWTIGIDPDAQASLAFGTRGQPETFAITGGGAIVGYQFGPATLKGLESMLSAARGEPA